MSGHVWGVSRVVGIFGCRHLGRLSGVLGCSSNTPSVAPPRDPLVATGDRLIGVTTAGGASPALLLLHLGRALVLGPILLILLLVRQVPLSELLLVAGELVHANQLDVGEGAAVGSQSGVIITLLLLLLRVIVALVGDSVGECCHALILLVMSAERAGVKASLATNTRSQVFSGLRLANLVLIERFTTKFLLRFLDQLLLQHLLGNVILWTTRSLMHPLCTLMNRGPRAKLLRACLTCHSALIIKLHALIDLIDNAHHVALRATDLLLLCVRGNRLILHLKLTDLLLDLLLVGRTASTIYLLTRLIIRYLVRARGDRH